MSWRRLVAVVSVCGLTAVGAVGIGGCGSAGRVRATSTLQSTGTIPAYLKERLRPIGRGIRFHPTVHGPVTGRCEARFGARFEAHIELFGANKVVLLPAGLGTRAPRTLADGRLTDAKCFGDVVTLDPTGIVYVRRGAVVTLGTLFRAWGERLTQRRIASFTGGMVRVFINGRRRRKAPARVRINPRAEIVVEVGPYVPPHKSFAYPPVPQVP